MSREYSGFQLSWGWGRENQVAQGHEGSVVREVLLEEGSGRYHDYSICLLFFVQIEVQQLQYQMDSVDGDFENMTEQKLKNRADLLARQQKTKYYQKVKVLPRPIVRPMH